MTNPLVDTLKHIHMRITRLDGTMGNEAKGAECVAALDYTIDLLKTLPVQPFPLTDEPAHGDWLAVVDDSDCAVGLGGPGHLWQYDCRSYLSPTCYHLIGVGSPYTKTIFRRATPAEVALQLSS